MVGNWATWQLALQLEEGLDGLWVVWLVGWLVGGLVSGLFGCLVGWWVSGWVVWLVG